MLVALNAGAEEKCAYNQFDESMAPGADCNMKLGEDYAQQAGAITKAVGEPVLAVLKAL